MQCKIKLINFGTELSNFLRLEPSCQILTGDTDNAAWRPLLINYIK